MPVDIYGDCGTHKCPEDVGCFQYISDTYKFYISFENSLCKDYVTEKFFQAMSHDILPIVYGGADYSEIAPPKSYINVLPDFEKPKDLATFLTVRIIGKSWKVVKKKFEEQNKKQSIKNVYILNWDELRIQNPIFNFLYDNLLFGW